MRKRLPITYTAQRGWHVALPTYQMIPGTFQPITKGLIDKDGVLAAADTTKVLTLTPTVEVDFPDEYMHDDLDGIDPGKIRNMYKDHPLWSRLAIDTAGNPAIE
jgi:hypothetical protein